MFFSQKKHFEGIGASQKIELEAFLDEEPNDKFCLSSFRFIVASQVKLLTAHFVLSGVRRLEMLAKVSNQDVFSCKQLFKFSLKISFVVLQQFRDRSS